MKKLKDLIGTCYIYDDYTSILQKILNEETEIDLAGCKFTPPNEKILRNYYSKIKFINSKDERLNAVLEHNNNVFEKPVRVPDELLIDYNSVEELMQLLDSLDRKGFYRISERGAGRNKRIVTIVLITMLLPGITLDVGDDLPHVFKLVRNEWVKMHKPHTKYWLCDNTALVLLEKQMDGNFRLLDNSIIDEEMLVYKYRVLPYEFGTERLAKNEEFSRVFLKCMSILDEHHEAEHRMIDFIRRN